MRIAYIQNITGVAGDMILAALIDAGASLDGIQGALAAFGEDIGRVKVFEDRRGSIGGLRLEVEAPEGIVRTWANIRGLMEDVSLPDRVRERSMAALQSLAEAESRVHRVPVDSVHFHELGGADTIVDVVGTMVALEDLALERVCCSPVGVGKGFVRTEHGLLPNPAPATLELLEGIPITQIDVVGEVTTPTGAAIVRTICACFGGFPRMRVASVGYGLGSREFDIPNALRVVIGEVSEAVGDTVVLLEATIDDATPEILAHGIERLLAAGALDAWLTPVQMKKGRSGVVLSVLCDVEEEERLAEAIFSETTTFGVRRAAYGRYELDREMVDVTTEYGAIPVKVGRWRGVIVTASPELSACEAAAARTGTPLKAVYEAAKRAFAADVSTTD